MGTLRGYLFLALGFVIAACTGADTPTGGATGGATTGGQPGTSGAPSTGGTAGGTVGGGTGGTSGTASGPPPSTEVPGISPALYASPTVYSCVRNFYVATNGSDSNPGTQAAPWQTIQHADSNSRQAGDCINVQPGTYPSGWTISHGGNLATPTGYVVYRCAVRV